MQQPTQIHKIDAELKAQQLTQSLINMTASGALCASPKSLDLWHERLSAYCIGDAAKLALSRLWPEFDKELLEINTLLFNVSWATERNQALNMAKNKIIRDHVSFWLPRIKAACFSEDKPKASTGLVLPESRTGGVNSKKKRTIKQK